MDYRRGAQSCQGSWDLFLPQRAGQQTADVAGQSSHLANRARWMSPSTRVAHWRGMWSSPGLSLGPGPKVTSSTPRQISSRSRDPLLVGNITSSSFPSDDLPTPITSSSLQCPCLFLTFLPYWLITSRAAKIFSRHLLSAYLDGRAHPKYFKYSNSGH